MIRSARSTWARIGALIDARPAWEPHPLIAALHVGTLCVVLMLLAVAFGGLPQ